MSEWRHGTLGELAAGIRGVAYAPGQLKDHSDETTVTLLRANNIRAGSIHFENVQFVDQSAVSDIQTLKAHDIAVCMSNGSRALVGKAARYKEAGRERTTVGAFCSIFRPEPSVHAGYVASLFQGKAYRAHLDVILAGSAINNLRNRDIEALPLQIAPVEEQPWIARILDTLDTQIEKTQALIAKLEQVKEGLLHDLLTRGVDESGELRPSPEEAPELYKKSELGLIPRPSEAIALGALVVWSSGGTPSREVESNWRGTVPLLTPKDMKAFELDDASEHVSKSAAIAESRIMPNGTVFVVVRGMILAHSFPVVLARTAMAFNQDIKAATPGERISKDFLAYWLSASKDHFLKKVTESTHGTKKLDMEPLNGTLVVVPRLAEQQAIVSRIEAMVSRIQKEKANVAKLNVQKTGLMDDLLTGRVRVTPLLERETAEAS